MGEVKSKVRNMNFKKTKFQLFKEWVNKTLRETALRGKGEEKSWQTFKDPFYMVKELLIFTSKKSRKEDKRLVWLNWDLLVKLKGNRERTDSWSRNLYPKNNAGMLLSCVWMGSGRLKCSWSWAWQGMQRMIILVPTGTSARKGRQQTVYFPVEHISQTHNNGGEEGWGNKQLFCLSLHWKSFCPYLSGGWTSRQRLREPRPSDSKDTSDLKPPQKPQYV